jgi:hypothetical protein
LKVEIIGGYEYEAGFVDCPIKTSIIQVIEVHMSEDPNITSVFLRYLKCPSGFALE